MCRYGEYTIQIPQHELPGEHAACWTPGLLSIHGTMQLRTKSAAPAMQENVMPHKDELLSRVQDLNQVR